MKNPIGPLWAQFTGFLSDLAESLGEWRQRRRTARQERAAAREVAEQTKRNAEADALKQEADAAAEAIRTKAGAKAEAKRKKTEALETVIAARATYKGARAMARAKQLQQKQLLTVEPNSPGLTSKDALWAILKLVGYTLVPIALTVPIGMYIGQVLELVTLTLIWYCIIALVLWWLAPKFFVKIPLNHIVCVVISGKLVHYMCNKADKVKLAERLSKFPEGHKIHSGFTMSQIVTREDHWFWGLFVQLFNMHFKSWRPSDLKKVKVIPTSINPDRNEQSELSDWVRYRGGKKEEETEFLRLEIPRVVFINDAELSNQVRIDAVMSVTGICILNPYEVFFVHSDVSAWIDLMLYGAFTNYVARLNLTEFATHPFIADATTIFNRFMRDENHPTDDDPAAADLRKIGNAGMVTAGFIITGTATVVDYALDESEERLRKAAAERQVAAEERESAQLRAEAAAATIVTEGEAKAKAEATLIRARGQASAEAITAEGQAKADAVGKMAEKIAGNQAIATVLANEALARGNITTLVQGGQGIVPTLPIPTNTPKPTDEPTT